jgi:glycosyltransferase involved in cell wall biosynthesis
LKIGFDGKRATCNFRGLGNYSRGLVEGLIELNLNHKFFLYTPNFKDQRAITWILKNQNHLSIKTPNSTLGNLLPGIWRSYFLAQDLKRDGIDLFHGLSHEIPFQDKKSTYKSVVTIHDLIFLRYPEFFPLIDRMVYYQKFKYSILNSDLVIAICEQTKNDIIHYFHIDPKKVVVHYQSIDPIFYIESSKENIETVLLKFNLLGPFILNVGAFEERKNQKKLLQAYLNIADKIPHDLVFIGNGGKYLKEIELQLSNHPLKNRVKILKNVGYLELPKIYQASSLFVFPSHFEGFGIPIVEALFSKVPVITSHGSCFPESAGKHSKFIDPNSINEIEKAIEDVLQNKNTRESMISEGLVHAQNFTRISSSNSLNEIYTGLF